MSATEYDALTALIVVDMQNDFCHADGVMGRHGEDLSDFPDTIQTIKGLLDTARVLAAQGMPLVPA